MQIKSLHVLMILFLVGGLFIVFGIGDMITLSLWGIGIILFVAVLGGGYFWGQAEIQKKADIIITELGHFTMHPDDIRQASGYDAKGEKQLAFSTIALGGYQVGDLWNEPGDKAFIVTKPEFVWNFPEGRIIPASLRKITVNGIPDFVVEELNRLDGFSIDKVTEADNLYLGTTSFVDGSYTQEGKRKEAEWVKNNEDVTFYKKLLDEAYQELEKYKKSKHPVYIQSSKIERVSP